MVPGRRRQSPAGEPRVVLVEVEGRELRQVLAPERLGDLPNDPAGLQQRLGRPTPGILVAEILVQELAERVAGRVAADVDLHGQFRRQALGHPPAAVDGAGNLATLPGQGIERCPDGHLPNARPPFAYPGHPAILARFCGIYVWD